MTKERGRAAAVISYITPLGWLAAFVFHRAKRTTLSAYHLRQSLFLHLTFILIYLFQVAVLYVPVAGSLLGFVLLACGVAWLICWAIGIIYAMRGEMSSIPVIDIAPQRLFNGLK